MRVWETADGLLPTNVRSITQSRDGYLWLAAFDGFVRFDGTRATLFSGKNVAELPGAESGPGFCRLDGTVLGCDFGWTLVFS